MRLQSQNIDSGSKTHTKKQLDNMTTLTSPDSINTKTGVDVSFGTRFLNSLLFIQLRIDWHLSGE